MAGFNNKSSKTVENIVIYDIMNFSYILIFNEGLFNLVEEDFYLT